VDKNGKEKLSHKALQTAQEEDPEGFPSQYMLDSSGYKKVSFTEALLMQQTITRDQMPSQIEPFACYVLGDLADTTNSTSDYSVLAIMLVDKENRGFIVEVYRDRYSQYEICNLIAKINHDHKPIQIIIEDARGASKMKGDIQRASQDLGDKQIPLNFVKVNNTKGAKAIRVGKLEGKLRDRILFFLNSIDCYQDLIAEFRDFGSAPHDDIPDAIGFCEYVLPDLRGAPQDPNAAEAAQRIMNEKAFFEMIHGSPEDAIRHEMIEPMPETIIDESPDDLWDPFSAGTFRK
jgi:predicted phage terminase large subunit-like protein